MICEFGSKSSFVQFMSGFFWHQMGMEWMDIRVSRKEEVGVELAGDDQLGNKIYLTGLGN